MYNAKSISEIGFLVSLVLSFSLAATTQAQKSATVLLAGYKHIPPVPSSGSGNITVTLRGDTLAVKGYFNQLGSQYYGAFVHYGKEDERGNQLFRLSTDLNEKKTGGTFDSERNRWVLTQDQLQALAEGSLYINIYSADYPRGELRGQIPPLK